jgi:hypothetical protein
VSQFKCNTVSVSISACRCSSVVFSSKVGREKKKSLETVLRVVSAAVAHLPTAVSLLLLEALFMQISGVSLALTWPRRLCLLRVLLCGSLCYKLSPFQALGKVTLHPHSQACVFIYRSHGKWVFPPLLWSFPPSTTLTSFPAPRCWVRTPASPEPLLPTQLVYLQSWEGFPSPNLQRSGRPTLFTTCLYCSYCLLLSFSFFPGWGSVCPRGYADLTQGCLWKYCILLSSPCLRLSKHLGTGVWWPGGPPGFSI